MLSYTLLAALAATGVSFTSALPVGMSDVDEHSQFKRQASTVGTCYIDGSYASESFSWLFPAFRYSCLLPSLFLLQSPLMTVLCVPLDLPSAHAPYLTSRFLPSVPMDC